MSKVCFCSHERKSWHPSMAVRLSASSAGLLPWFATQWAAVSNHLLDKMEEAHLGKRKFFLSNSYCPFGESVAFSNLTPVSCGSSSLAGDTPCRGSPPRPRWCRSRCGCCCRRQCCPGLLLSPRQRRHNRSLSMENYVFLAWCNHTVFL